MAGSKRGKEGQYAHGTLLAPGSVSSRILRSRPKVALSFRRQESRTSLCYPLPSRIQPPLNPRFLLFRPPHSVAYASRLCLLFFGPHLTMPPTPSRLQPSLNPRYFFFRPPPS